MLRQIRAVATGLVVCGASALGAACANASAPPGGPPDTQPPVVISVTPASGSTDIHPRQVEVKFNEVISETPKGAQDLGSLVFISPKSGVPQVSWERDRLTIRSRRGFKPNTVYSVEIRPGIVDLRSNALDSAVRVVFSTGGEIPQTQITGVVFDWTAGRAAGNALVEAIASDTTVVYQTLADSTGRFTLRYVPPGPYTLRALIDRNNNRELEPLEPWDSTHVTIATDSTAELYAFQHDTLPVRIQTIVYSDSAREVRVTFDKPFAPGSTFAIAQFRLRAADSTPVVITQVVTAPQRRIADSVSRAQRADSIARANRDTTAVGRARADSAARKATADSIAAVARAAEASRIEALRRGNRPVNRVDSTPPPKMSRPLPFNELILVLQEPLVENKTYVLSATGLRSLSGTEKPTPVRTFVAPKKVVKDSTAKSDSTTPRKPPPTSLRATQQPLLPGKGLLLREQRH